MYKDIVTKTFVNLKLHLLSQGHSLLSVVSSTILVNYDYKLAELVIVNDKEVNCFSHICIQV